MFDKFKRSAFLALLLCFYAVSGVWADDGQRLVKVMTRNMDAGTDLGFVFVYLGTNPTLGVSLTYQELLSSQIPERAGRLADEIAAQKPYLVALQEVTLWQTVSMADGSATVLYDQLDLLRTALSARRLHYEVVAVNKLTEAVAPMSSDTALSYTDRDVILARSDLKQSELDLSSAQTHRYSAVFTFMGIPSIRGWMSVDAKVRGKRFRFVNTHLESPNPFAPEAVEFQVMQADELIRAMKATELRVILAGDFNSNAEAGPDNTDTTVHILAAGYTDVWRAAHPGDPGLTWPLFLEDFYSGVPISPYERIDLIFTRDLEILDVQRVGVVPSYASDHAGVVAALEVDE